MVQEHTTGPVYCRTISKILNDQILTIHQVFGWELNRQFGRLVQQFDS